jgi:predicted DNA-binding protein
MSMFSERLQILVSPEQRRRLEAEAKRRGTSVATLVREAVDDRYGSVTRGERVRALEEIREMRGTFVSPEDLDRISEAQRDMELDAVVRSNRR